MTPDRAAAVREVEAVLRRVDGRTVPPTGDWFSIVNEYDGFHDWLDPAELAALVVDAVLGQET